MSINAAECFMYSQQHACLAVVFLGDLCVSILMQKQQLSSVFTAACVCAMSLLSRLAMQQQQ